MESKLEAVRNSGKIMEWKQRLEKSRKSGLSVQDWCDENGISVKLKEFNPGKVYIATGYTDLRNGIDGLAGIIERLLP